MPMTSVLLRPGVDVQKTFALNEAGVSNAQLIRYKEGLIEAYGGWQSYVPFALNPIVKDIHPWQDAAGITHGSFAGTGGISVITSCLGTDITPQTLRTDIPPKFSVSSGSSIVTVADPAGGIGPFNTVFFRTPVAVGDVLLNGAYSIVTVLSTGSYTIVSSVIASTTITTSGLLPYFTTSTGSQSVTVTLRSNNFQQIPGLFYSFYAPTSVGGLTIQGPYQIASIIDSTNFKINASAISTTSTTAYMNAGNAELDYYMTIGPQITGSGWGVGAWGSGGWGTGVTITGAAGTPISATNWTQDNWGEVLLACKENGPIFQWSPDSGFSKASVINTAPFFNGGIFISMPQQILVAWRSCQEISGSQSNLLVRWSDANDFTNWEASAATSAGSFVIPTGSIIVGGIQVANQGIIWTDIDVWVMRYIGGDLIFNFSKVGSGCGLVGPHAVGVLAGVTYWMGTDNFYMMSGAGVIIIPCTVWDFVFQNIQTDPLCIRSVVCATNASFNEVTWFFTSNSSVCGDNDAYVKYNTLEGAWDSGFLPRSAWTDVSVLGQPIGTDNSGNVFQHETGETTSGVSAPSFQSGFWSISDGNDLSFVDYIIPDFKFTKTVDATAATIELTVTAVDYPLDTPRSAGPFTITPTTQYINPRIRGRMLSVKIASEGRNWWRLGRLRYRWASAGRR